MIESNIFFTNIVWVAGWRGLEAGAGAVPWWKSSYIAFDEWFTEWGWTVVAGHTLLMALCWMIKKAKGQGPKPSVPPIDYTETDCWVRDTWDNEVRESRLRIFKSGRKAVWNSYRNNWAAANEDGSFPPCFRSNTPGLYFELKQWWVETGEAAAPPKPVIYSDVPVREKVESVIDGRQIVWWRVRRPEEKVSRGGGEGAEW